MIELLLPYAEERECHLLVRNSLLRSATSIRCIIPAPRLAHTICLLSYFVSLKPPQPRTQQETQRGNPPACFPTALLPAQQRLLLSFGGLACFFIRTITPKDARRNKNYRKQLLLRLFNEKTPPRLRMSLRRGWTGLNSHFQKCNSMLCDFRRHDSSFAEIESINLPVSLLCHHSAAFSSQISSDDAAWERDASRLSCAAPRCGKRFSFIHRRHHCRCANVLLAIQALPRDCLTPVSCAGFVGC